jgi:membrane protein involved in colicin uptake
MGARFVPILGLLRSRRLRARAGLWLCAALLLCGSTARADRVHLAGGSVIEGKVTRDADKIVILLDSGSVRLEASSVVRIERSETAADRIAAQRAALPNDAIAERLVLAAQCREERLVQCERELLREIIALDPDQAEARARLGYVRSEHGWQTRAEQRREQEAAAPASTPAHQVALRKAELERDAAELARQRAELELESQRLAQRNAEAEKRTLRLPEPAPLWLAAPTLYPPAGRTPWALTPPQAGPSFGINGVRDPASYFR